MKIFELTSWTEVTELKRRIETILAKLKFDIVYKSHFIKDRLLERESGLTISELVKTFQKFRNKYKHELLKAKKTSLKDKTTMVGIVQDYEQNIVIVFSIYGDKLTLRTAKRHNPATYGTGKFDEIDFPV